MRQDATHFIIAPGHDKPQIERVVEGNGEYDVVEKLGTKVRSIVRSLNPRANPA